MNSYLLYIDELIYYKNIHIVVLINVNYFYIALLYIYSLIVCLKTFVISKKETEKVLTLLNKTWKNIPIPKIKNIKVFEIETNRSIVVIDYLVGVFINNEIILPFLGKTEILEKFSSITVDSGSIKFICNGAKILRPGIVKFDKFAKNDIVVVKDEKFEKFLSVGLALEDSLVAEKLQKGYVIDNLHFVGDKFWNTFKEISFRL
jgi:predicted RNA-binding protein (TIGR00451 family)